MRECSIRQTLSTGNGSTGSGIFEILLGCLFEVFSWNSKVIRRMIKISSQLSVIVHSTKSIVETILNRSVGISGIAIQLRLGT